MSEERKELKFVCPQCGKNKLECCENDAFISSIITCLDEDGDFDYAAPIIHDSSVERFQCDDCGFVLRNAPEEEPLTDNLEVIEWLKKNCKQE